MSCVHLTLFFLSLSICHQDAPPERLEGLWVGTLETGSDLQLIRAEFVGARSGVTGTVRLAGGGDLTLVRASESDRHVCFVMRRGGDEFVFVGALRKGSIGGRVLHAGKQMLFELHRTSEIASRSGGSPTR
jgi:hypothetical protein